MPWALYMMLAYHNRRTGAGSAKAEPYIVMMEQEGVGDAAAVRL